MKTRPLWAMGLIPLLAAGVWCCGGDGDESSGSDADTDTDTDADTDSDSDVCGDPLDFSEGEIQIYYSTQQADYHWEIAAVLEDLSQVESVDSVVARIEDSDDEDEQCVIELLLSGEHTWGETTYTAGTCLEEISTGSASASGVATDLDGCETQFGFFVSVSMSK